MTNSWGYGLFTEEDVEASEQFNQLLGHKKKKQLEGVYNPKKNTKEYHDQFWGTGKGSKSTVKTIPKITEAQKQIKLNEQKLNTLKYMEGDPRGDKLRASVGTTTTTTSTENADEAINTSRWQLGETRGHTLDKHGRAAGGKGSVANNKEILRRMRESQLEKKVQQLQPTPESKTQSNQNQQPTLETQKLSNKVGMTLEEAQKKHDEIMRSGGYHYDSTGKKVTPHPTTSGSLESQGKAQQEQIDKMKKGESAWSQMSNSKKLEAVANIASALQKLDGSKDELIWKGTGWGGIGSGGHSGYVG